MRNRSCHNSVSSFAHKSSRRALTHPKAHPFCFVRLHCCRLWYYCVCSTVLLESGGNRTCSEIVRVVSEATDRIEFFFLTNNSDNYYFSRCLMSIRLCSKKSISCTKITLMSMNCHNKWIHRLAGLASHAFIGTHELHVDLQNVIDKWRKFVGVVWILSRCRLKCCRSSFVWWSVGI